MAPRSCSLLLAAALAWPAHTLRKEDADIVGEDNRALQLQDVSAVPGTSQAAELPGNAIGEREGRSQSAGSLLAAAATGAHASGSGSGSLQSGCGTSACLPECFALNVVYYYDMEGTRRTEVHSPQECQARCKSHPGCYYYSYYPDGGCHLQDTGARKGSSGKAFGGSARNCRTCFKPEMSYVEDLPIHDSRSREDTAFQCQERCARMQGCAFFTFWHDGGCHLHGENAHTKQAVGAIAGPKACPGQSLPAQRPLEECYNFNVVYYYDMVGQSRTETATPQLCLKRCQETKGCAYYSWYPDGGCHLQDLDATKGGSGQAVGGPSHCSSCFSPEMMIADDLPGSRRSREATPAKCQERCRSVGGCAYFTFWSDGGCHLHGAGTRMVKGVGAMAGPRSCS